MNSNELIWYPESDRGFYPVQCDGVYSGDYWERYRRQDRTDIGDALNSCRLSLVHRWHAPNTELCDIGIGGGRFVEDCSAMLGGGLVYGFDVNPVAVSWLEARRKFADPSEREFPSLTFWDSLEHIEEPAEILKAARRFVFVSIPIFTGPDHVLRSKHFRKDEHFWYYTRQGFVRYMQNQGFELLEQNTMEQSAGREDIESCAVKRGV
jgi:hypothetical protein